MRKYVLAAVLVLVAGGAQAATLNVVGGQLLGASGVIVNGSSYNVEFLDGTCIDLYSGCDDVSDFTFQTQAAALLASQALLDQVFLDGFAGLFDTDPSLINGCSFVERCRALTPHDIPGFSLTDIFPFAASNFYLEIGDVAMQDATTGVAQDLSINEPQRVYAVWTPVPEPGTAVLMGLGLLGLSVSKRRQR